MSRIDRIQAVADRYTERKLYAGIEWCVEKRGEIVHKGQSGVADAESGAAIPDDALYRIYSMTKPIVSVMALILIEQGKLRLMDPVAQYDPRFRDLKVVTADGEVLPLVRPLIVDDVMTHRGGFTYEFITGCHIAPLYRENSVTSVGEETLDAMMDRVTALPLAFQPGTKFRYGVNTDVLANVVQRAADRDLEELLREHIFEPLGMDSTSFGVPDSEVHRLMPMYGVTDITGMDVLNMPTQQELTPSNVDDMYPVNDSRFRRGGHGLYSTLTDYVAFARMLLDGKALDGTPILSPAMLDMMRQNRIPPEQMPIRVGANVLRGYGWGLGVRVMVDRGQSLALTGDGELGWGGAASTYFWVDPGRDMVGVSMTQYLGAITPLNEDIRTAAYQAV